MKENEIAILSGQVLKDLLTMEDCILAMKDAFASLGRGEVEVPLRTLVDRPEDNGLSLFMPVYSAGVSRLCLKTIMQNRDNPDKGLPLIHAVVQLFDSATGAPLALMDGEVITSMRTGAVSGLATDLLARATANTAAIIGTGVQGETQLEAVCSVRDIERAYVFDLDQQRAASFATKMADRLKVEVKVAGNKEVLSEADIICTSTSSSTPVFNDGNIKAGAHINGVGSYRPEMAEIPAETIRRSKVVVDQLKGCLSEAGDLIQPIESGIIAVEHLHGELGDLVNGTITARESEEEITVFKSVGIAIQDLATANLALELSKKHGVGQTIWL